MKYNILTSIDKLYFTCYIISMDDKVTNFGKRCRKLRIDKGWIMAVLAFNLEEPYPATKEWKAAANAMKRLKTEIDIRAAPYTVALPDV